MAALRSLSLAVAFALLMALPLIRAAGATDIVRYGWEMAWPKTDFTKRAVALEEIISGGPPKDGIPPIDAPVFATAGALTELGETEPVISVEIEGERRAYPLRVLIWHELVNDEIAGVPIAVTYCPLCNSALVFDRRIEGRTHSFGTTGNLRHSDLLMYDRETESWWQQFTGEAIVGSLTGARLTVLPSRTEAFALFKARAGSDARVLIPNNPKARAYGRTPYVRYDSSETPFLYRGAMPSGIAPLARVVVIGGEAWSLDALRRAGTIEHGELRLSWTPGQASALDAATIAEGYDIGNVVVQRKSAEGLEDAPHMVSFAFAFRAFQPEGPIHGIGP